MAYRSTMLGYIAAAIPETFGTVLRGTPGRLSDLELPAAIVARGDEEVYADQSGRGWAARRLSVEVTVVAKAASGLDAAMDDLVEAVEAAVLYDESLAAAVDAVRPAGSSAIEYDDESEQDVASCSVMFDLYYTHWPVEPAGD